MHILDVIFGILLVLLILNGIRRGFVASFIQLIGLGLVVVAITRLGPWVRSLVSERFGLGEILASIVAYILIFLIIMLMVKLIIFFIHRIVDFLRLKWLNRLLGAFFGLLNGIIIICILIVLMKVSPFASESYEFTRGSYIFRSGWLLIDQLEKHYPGLKKAQQPIQEKLEEEIDKGKAKLEEQLQVKKEALDSVTEENSDPR
ncbi:MAG: CvpA family protein [Candidatus Cloacimonetes bacterium]|nr:CvpA family protein [Candidatus Cloacimonadota bacterium]